MDAALATAGKPPGKTLRKLLTGDAIGDGEHGGLAVACYMHTNKDKIDMKGKEEMEWLQSMIDEPEMPEPTRKRMREALMYMPDVKMAMADTGGGSGIRVFDALGSDSDD